MKKIEDIEADVTNCICLMTIVKQYCESNYDKAEEIAILTTAIDLVLDSLKNISRDIDLFSMNAEE